MSTSFYRKLKQKTKQQFDYFNYDEWFRYFAISLAWRTVVTKIEGFRKELPILADYADIALEDWRQYLRGEETNAAPYEHHVFFFGYVSAANTENFPNKFHSYTLAAVDATIAHSSKSIVAYTKLPGIMFWSTIYPHKAHGWENTVLSERGVIKSPQTAPDYCGQFLEERMETSAKMMQAMSDKQRQVISETVLQNPERWEGSLSASVHDADQSWRGY